eukprot:XP_011663330.1 PREDICTED: uncharacterized protein LOC584152 [Strongylocentrotus purpuratus]
MKAENRKLYLTGLFLILYITSVQGYTCTDGLVIDDENVCDFREDCSDGLDESTCPATCDFEAGLCEWYHDASLDLNWTMFMNNEPEWYYGPGADHTLNSVNGHYLYIDDTYSEVDQKAIIRSPTYQMAARRCIFSMWYYAYGVDMGTLKVLQYTPSNDRNYNLMTVVDIGEDKSTKDRWNLYEVQVEACAENFQLSIEAKDRYDYSNTGGYAIDDLRFEGCAYTLPLPPGGSCDADTEETCDSGHCYPKSERCDYTPNCCDGTDESTQNCADYRMCDFETNMCYWGQLTDDTLDWTRKTGGTGTGDTGPWKDHTTFSNNGYFIYTEVDDAFPGDTYRIGSFYIQPTSSGCEIRFYHHMRGSGIGTLNLYTRTKIDGPMTRLWYSDTAHGNYWLYQRVSLTSEDAFQVVFEGVRGSTNLGDIALDDITFTPECVESKEPLPPADVIPTQPNHCELGMRPCDIDQCIDESYYCDFNPDCPVGGEDELYCRKNFTKLFSYPKYILSSISEVIAQKRVKMPRGAKLQTEDIARDIRGEVKKVLEDNNDILDSLVSKNTKLEIQQCKLSTEMTKKLWSCLKSFTSLNQLTISDSSLSFSRSPPELLSVTKLSAHRMTSQSYEGVLSSLHGLRDIDVSIDVAETSNTFQITTASVPIGQTRPRDDQFFVHIRLHARPALTTDREIDSGESIGRLSLLFEDQSRNLQRLHVSGEKGRDENALVDLFIKTEQLASLNSRSRGGSLNDSDAVQNTKLEIQQCKLSTEMTKKLWSCLKSFTSLNQLTISDSSLSFPRSPPELLSVEKLSAHRMTSQSYEEVLSSLPGLLDIDITLNDADRDIPQITAVIRLTGGEQLTHIRLAAPSSPPSEKNSVSSETMRGLALLIREQTKNLQWLCLTRVKCRKEEDLVELVESCTQVKTMNHLT